MQDKTNGLNWTPLAITAVAILSLYVLWKVLVIFLLAALFAFLIQPIVALFSRKLPHVLSIITVYVVIAILLFMLVWLVLPMVSRQLHQMMTDAPVYVSRAREVLDRLQEGYFGLPAYLRTLGDRFLDGLEAVITSLASQTIPAILALVSGVLGIIFIPLLAFFMLLGQSSYRQMMFSLIPPNHRETVENLTKCLSYVLRRFIRGEVLMMLSVGVLTGVGLYFVGMPYAVVFGILAGSLEAIPSLGPVITTLIIGVVSVLTDPLLALQAVGVAVAVQLIENALLVPIIMGKAVGLSPVTVLFAVFLGGFAVGILGALVAIPLALMIKVVILYFYAGDQLLVEQCGIPLPSRPQHGKRKQAGDSSE